MAPGAVLRSATRAGLNWVVMRGHMWVRDVFTTALRDLRGERPTRSRVGLIVRAHVLLGDLNLVLGATEIAITEYKQALRYAPRNPKILFDVAQACEIRGRFAEAVRWHRAAIRHRPGFRASKDSLSILLAEKRTASHSNFSAEPGEAACHALAGGDAAKAMQLIHGERAMWAELVRIRCLGAVGRTQPVLTALTRILARAEGVELNPPDWFYLPDALWDSECLWRTLYLNRVKIKGLGVLNFSGDEVFGPPEIEFGSSSWERKTRAAVIRMHLARTSSNARAIRTLLERFPAWKDLNAIMSFFKEHGRMPSRAELASSTLMR